MPCPGLLRVCDLESIRTYADQISLKYLILQYILLDQNQFLFFLLDLSLKSAQPSNCVVKSDYKSLQNQPNKEETTDFPTGTQKETKEANFRSKRRFKLNLSV